MSEVVTNIRNKIILLLLLQHNTKTVSMQGHCIITS